MLKKTLICALVLSLFCTCRASADVFVMSGSGTVVDPIPLTEGGTAQHDATGTATFLGAYTGTGIVRLDMFTGPTTADFSSDVPFVFTSDGSGDQLVVNYAGEATLVDVGGGLFDSTWVATFTPIAGLSTGIFANAVGSFVVTAETDTFTPGQTGVAYTWSGSGTLTFVPEPTSLILIGSLGLVVSCVRRRQTKS